MGSNSHGRVLEVHSSGGRKAVGSLPRNDFSTIQTSAWLNRYIE